MNKEMAKSLEVSQVKALARMIQNRDEDFVPLSDEELAALDLNELKKLHSLYHEIAYAPPPRR